MIPPRDQQHPLGLRAMGKLMENVCQLNVNDRLVRAALVL